MALWNRRTLFILAASILLAVVASLILQRPVRNYFGYCAGTGRALSDAEKVDVVVSLLWDRDPGVIPIYKHTSQGDVVIGHRRPSKFVPYNSKQEFLLVNKNCCEVVQSTPEGGGISIWDKVTGRISAYVHVHYLVRYVNEAGTVDQTYFDQYHAISNCGHIWSGI